MVKEFFLNLKLKVYNMYCKYIKYKLIFIKTSTITIYKRIILKIAQIISNNKSF